MERKESLQSESPIQRLLTAKDVAEILGIAVKTVHKLVREAKFGCVQVTAKERRFTEQQIQEYIESRSITVRIDKPKQDRVKSNAPKGGKKSLGFSRRSLIEEMRQWQ
jgi:excisionase family DNA binding protein